MWRKRLIPIIAELIKPYQSDLWPIYFKIFNETNSKYRRRFFAEPLVKFLWTKFIACKEDEIVQYV